MLPSSKSLLAALMTLVCLLVITPQALAGHDAVIDGDTPSARWKFEELSGTSFADGAGNSYDGLFSAAPTRGNAGVFSYGTAIGPNGSQTGTVPRLEHRE
jgi:hypothetical protein